MADITIHFNCRKGNDSFTETYLHYDDDGNESIAISITEEGTYPLTVILDKSTAIKFAKTIRTNINKMED